MKRLLHVFEHEVNLNYKTFVISVVGVAGLLLLFSMGRWLEYPRPIDLWQAFPPVMILAGAVVTSGIFSELGKKERRTEYLLRPADAWEKVLAKLVLTSVGYWLMMVVAFVAASGLGALLYVVLTNGSDLTGSFSHGRWWAIALDTLHGYLVVHAVFFFGSVYFRRHALGHTLLAIVGWATSYAIIAVVAVRTIFHPYFAGVRRLSDSAVFSFQAEVEDLFTRRFLDHALVWQVIVEILLILFFWGLSWLRLRETEA